MEKFKKFIPFIVGAVLIGVGIFVNIRSGELVKVCTERTTATVVSMQEEIDTSDATTDSFRYIYYPIISYEAGDRTIEKQLSSGSNTPEYRIGETLEILYNPNNVEEFIVAGENQNITWIILVGIGAAFIVAGVVLLFKK